MTIGPDPISMIRLMSVRFGMSVDLYFSYGFPGLGTILQVIFQTLEMDYSHSIVAGGFELMSYTTRLIPRTSLIMRFEMVPSVS